MSLHLKNISELIARTRQRIKTRRVLRGVLITMTATAVAVVLAAIVAPAVAARPALLVALRIAPALVALATALLFILRPLRDAVPDDKIARLIEEKCGLSDRLVTAVESSAEPGNASPAIVDRLVTDTAARCEQVQVDRVIDPRHSFAYGAGSVLVVLVLVPLFLVGPTPLTQGIAVLYSPVTTASSNSVFISVAPGTTRVPRGSDLKIKASLRGFDSANVTVFIRRLDGPNWLANAMEPARGQGDFQHVIFNIQDSAVYYVESNGVRSPEFTLEVADLPFVRAIDLVLEYPAYTKLPNKKIENGGSIAVLKGTTVHVTTTLSAPAKSARIIFGDGSKVEMTADADNRFAGRFTVSKEGTYRVELTSSDGERYNGSNEYDISLIEDHLPTVVIEKPGRDVKVTNIQEVFTQVKAEDDYGVASLSFFYSVNGDQEKQVQLQDLKGDSARTLSGSHTFFLEEHALKPGDFISYYAKARDNSEGGGKEATSDIYFLEVRPFDRSFRQAQQQGGGGEGEQDSTQLSRRQREIIAATFRIQRELSSYTQAETDENFGTVTLSQERLKTDTLGLEDRIRRRLGEQLSSQPEFAKLVECLTAASKEMDSAINELRGRKTKESLAPEQRALQQLLRAEAIFRDIQVARGQGGGRSGGNESAQELADLFELQLDKMKNQYETVQREQQTAQDQKQDELARRLQELARRQQQQLEQQMRSQMNSQGGGGGGSQRQQQEMIDEARKLARELEKLSRDRRDPELQQSASQLQKAADEMQRSQSASGSNDSSQARAQSMRALEQLEQARRTLESAQRNNGQQSVQQLRQRAEEALHRQDEIAKDVEQLARENPKQDSTGQGTRSTEQKKQTIAERKQGLADQISGLERDIDQAARGLGQESQQSADSLRNAAGSIRRNRIPDRIRQNNQFIENGWFDQANEREKIIRNNIDEVLKNLRAAEGQPAKRNESESLQDALNRARELADNLESLKRRLESQRGENQQGQQAQNGQQQGGQQQGQQAQNGQQQGGQQQGQQQGGRQQGQQAQNGQQQGGRQQGRAQNGQQQGGQQQGQQQGGRQQGQQAQNGRQQGGRQQGQQQSGRQQGQQAQNSQQQGGQQQGGQQQGGQQGGQQQGQQAQNGQQQGGQQQGGQQQGGQQQGGRQASEQGGRGEIADDTRLGGGPPRGDRQLESELRQRIAEAEELRRQLPRNSDLARDLGRAIEQLRRFDPNAFSDPAQLAMLKNEVIDPLRQLELALAKRLQEKLATGAPGTIGESEAPDRYRKSIEDYYRRLSKGGNDK